MAAPQRNYPYNPQLAKALAFNRNDPQFNSVMSIYGSDGGHEGDVLPQGIQPGPGGNQVQQGPRVPDVAEVAEGVAAGQNTPPVEPAPIAANTSTTADQALAFGAPSSAGPSSATAASDATEEVVAQAIAHHETAIPQANHPGSQPEGGSSGSTLLLGRNPAAADLPSPTNASDTAHESTAGTSKSSSSITTRDSSTKARRVRKGAATPSLAPRRSLRESALRTAQHVHHLLVPRSRRGRRTIAAANSDGPSTSTINSTQSTPLPIQSAASTSKTRTANSSHENGKEPKAGLSAKALGKRRRVEPGTEEEEEEDQLAPADVEGPSPTKKARRVRSLMNRSTPARFDSPKEEPTSPSPLSATPKRKRALNDAGETSAGPSKRGRVANDEEERAPLLGPILLAAAPPRSWSVQAEPSVVGVVVRPVVVDARPPAAPNPPIPSFMVVLPATTPQPQHPPPPPPPPPYPLRRTFAKIFTRAG
ncbi:hypothetical protein FRC04_010300 [Tulasnella sp. 424]|nr:hypothetical protein FRC04_010300 [Tulasnella sp. 424]KAG8972682.1 hypothetical protein FRC05_009693 [Tulasnella sp. 425]